MSGTCSRDIAKDRLFWTSPSPRPTCLAPWCTAFQSAILRHRSHYRIDPARPQPPVATEWPRRRARLPVPSSAQGTGNNVFVASSEPAPPMCAPKPLFAVIANQTKFVHSHKNSISLPLNAVTGAALPPQHEMQPLALLTFKIFKKRGYWG